MHGAVVTVKVLVVKHVEVVATAWPLEAIMALQVMVMLGILMMENKPARRPWHSR